MSDNAKKKRFEPAKMVGWYNPIKLGRTAIEVTITTIFGRNADRRLLEAASNKHGTLSAPVLAEGQSPDKNKPTCCPEPIFYDASGQMTDGEFWFDFIADVGDGFNSTYSMAYHITKPELEFSGHTTKQGKILVFGGDQVYPIASEDFYKNNFTGPYTAAFPRRDDEDASKAPKIFAIPGNHDWYDSLAGFSFLFMENHFGPARWVAGWEAKQDRSYFAIKLPRGWWLFGTDMQLSSSLDTPQMEYFRHLMDNHVEKDEKIILCNAEPSWITQEMYRGNSDYDNEKIGFFEGRVLERRTDIFIAGDRHYYKRHAEMSESEMIDAGFRKKREDGKPPKQLTESTRRQRIVAGGGGAFLHPTHKEKVPTVGMRPRYRHKASFPDEKTSASLNWRNLLFLIWNWRFGILTGFLYVLTAWAFIAPIGQYGLREFWPALKVVLHTTVEQPIAAFWVVAIFGGFFLFTETTSKLYRFFGGAMHGLAHLAGVFFVSWFTSHMIDSSVNAHPANWTALQLLIGVAGIFAGGFLVGPTIMGVYLFISLNIFGRHHNEAFSAIKIQDYKNFLRLKIEEDGTLVIYPIGVKKVFKEWPNPLPEKGRIEPSSKRVENEPFLIEPPIRYSKPVNPPSPPTPPTP